MKKPHTSEHIVHVRRGKRGQNVVKVTNNLIIPLGIIEALLAAALCSLNYTLRYDTNTREDASMVNWEGVRLPCLDSSHVSKPIYNSTNTSTSSSTFQLPEWVFFTCAIVVPCGMVILGEIMKIMFPQTIVKKVMTGKFILHPTLRRIPRFICTFMMGGATLGAIVSLLKLLIASPRPHFLEVCAPNATRTEDCIVGGPWLPYTACEGDELEFHEALRSFPSYHASLAAYCGVWTVAYLSTAVRIAGVYGFNLLLTGAVLFMTCIGMTNPISTGFAYNNDAIVGGLLGGAAALYVSLVILNRFREREPNVKVIHKSPLDAPHPNMLPIIPLHGSHEHGRTVHFNEEDESDPDDEDNNNKSFFGNDPTKFFSMIPRASSRPKKVDMAKTTFPTQAFNENVGKTQPNGNIPKPPPLPTYGPPPSYSRADSLSAYNVPRQRFSAPAPDRTQPAPSYSESRNNVIRAFHGPESNDAPRARTETSSYF